MKLYDQTDFELNGRKKRQALLHALALAAPFFAAALAAFFLRIELLCTVCLIAAGSILIFLFDLRIKPQIRYGKYLAEAHSGLSRQTVGALVRIGQDPVYQDGVNFHEVILNIYEDMAPEGERRFLLDARKEIPQAWVNQDVVVTSHGSFILDAALAKEST